MLNVLIVMGYKIYFCTIGNNEPAHVHISKGKPNGNTTKIWITSTGGLVVAHNKSKIPKDDLIKYSFIDKGVLIYVLPILYGK